MTERIITLFSGIVKDPYLLSAVLAVLPVTEIKGSVLFAAASGFDPILSFLAAYGATLLLAAILSLTCPFFLALAQRSPRVGRFFSFFSDRLTKQADKIRGRASLPNAVGEGKIAFGVFAFVAIPLPFTGIWASALLAAILRLPAVRTFLALAAGNFAAGGIVLALSLLAGDRAEFVLTIFLILAAILLAGTLLKAFLSRRKQKV